MAGSRVPFNVRSRLVLKHDDLYNSETLAGAKTIALTEAQYQRLNPDGANRNVTLPAEEHNVGLWYCILNTATTAFNLVVKNDAAATIATVNKGEWVLVGCDGSAWVVLASTDVGGADYGATGISTDLIAESTAAAGVTIDGVLCKDNAVTASGGVTANVTGNVTGSSGSCTGNAATASAASALAAGARFTSTEQTGTGASQDIAHGLGTTPGIVWWSFSDIDAGLAAGPPPVVHATPGVHDATNIKMTVTTGVKFYAYAVK